MWRRRFCRERRMGEMCVYGIEETKEEDPVQWREKEKKKFEDVIQKMGVQVSGEIAVRQRSGKPREGAKPRPLIVKVTDDETRVSILRNAHRL